MVSAIAGIDGRRLSIVNVLTNSVARCWASAALPPLPQIRSLPPATERGRPGSRRPPRRRPGTPPRRGGRCPRSRGGSGAPPPSSFRLRRHRRSPVSSSGFARRRPDVVAAERADALGAERERRELRTESLELLPDGRLRRRTAVQQEVAAAARAADLAAVRPGRLRHRQHRLDRRVLGDVGVHPPLRHERVVEHGRRARRRRLPRRRPHRVRDLVELLHPEDRVLTSLSVQLDLRVDQARRSAGRTPCSRA